MRIFLRLIALSTCLTLNILKILSHDDRGAKKSRREDDGDSEEVDSSAPQRKTGPMRRRIDKNEHKALFEKVKLLVPGRLPVVIVGDMNCDMGKVNVDVSGKALLKLVSDFDLSDMQRVCSCELDIKVDGVFGKGLWKLNVKLLESEDVRKEYVRRYEGWSPPPDKADAKRALGLLCVIALHLPHGSIHATISQLILDFSLSDAAIFGYGIPPPPTYYADRDDSIRMDGVKYEEGAIKILGVFFNDDLKGNESWEECGMHVEPAVGKIFNDYGFWTTKWKFVVKIRECLIFAGTANSMVTVKMNVLYYGVQDVIREVIHKKACKYKKLCNLCGKDDHILYMSCPERKKGKRMNSKAESPGMGLRVKETAVKKKKKLWRTILKVLGFLLRKWRTKYRCRKRRKKKKWQKKKNLKKKGKKSRRTWRSMKIDLITREELRKIVYMDYVKETENEEAIGTQRLIKVVEELKKTDDLKVLRIKIDQKKNPISRQKCILVALLEEKVRGLEERIATLKLKENEDFLDRTEASLLVTEGETSVREPPKADEWKHVTKRSKKTMEKSPTTQLKNRYQIFVEDEDGTPKDEAIPASKKKRAHSNI
ncbi:unnamed protein product [Ranitomeya imitator]|uniref:Uncharacterized protein n=1 Tax=Ranitomeya imitator TaxID=111125 RepID=A0ABN9KUX4_9NEOB|nr:unnamed protein product [Ranitomeya imitator]